MSNKAENVTFFILALAHLCSIDLILSGVFLKLSSLNSANSVNHDKIQKWFGYQRYYPSGNKYITSGCYTSAFLVLPLDTYLNRYQTTDSSGKFFSMTTSRIVSIVRYRMSLVTTYLGFFLTMNSVKVI